MYTEQTDRQTDLSMCVWTSLQEEGMILEESAGTPFPLISFIEVAENLGIWDLYIFSKDRK